MSETTDTPVFDETVAATEPTVDEAPEADAEDTGEESDADALDAQAPHEDEDTGSHPI